MTNQINDFFNESSQEIFAQNIQRALEEIAPVMERDKFYSGASVQDLKQKMQAILHQEAEGLSLEEALREIKDLYLDHAITFHHPTYIAHLNCPILIPALVGDFIASTLNTAVETWDQSTSATLIEQEMINWACRLFQLPKNSDGVFTSGGTQSNFMGLLMARDHYAYTQLGANLKQNGAIPEMSKFRVFCSDKAHFSVKKNAALLGLGYDAVVTVATDERFKMKPKALEEAIRQEKQQGNLPIAVFATAGTTDFGSFDPLVEICAIAKAHEMWFHVDG
ncbi:MAG TPA: pyridoxal-dependent decarboxylase, partial [Microscillaceae bacterium]|nr:pyridoxal-dependent decarboxylase [Microscillaceae bacterium]